MQPRASRIADRRRIQAPRSVKAKPFEKVQLPDLGLLWTESTDSDDAFGPTIASYEVVDGWLVYHGRNGSLGIIVGKQRDLDQWVKFVDLHLEQLPVEDTEPVPWDADTHGGEREVHAAVKAAENVLKAFGARAEIRVTASPQGPAEGDASGNVLNLHNIHKGGTVRYSGGISVPIGAQVAAHEAAHLGFTKRRREAQKVMDILRQRKKAGEDALTAYHAFTNEFEGTMEAAALYALAPRKMQRSFPDVYEAVREWFGGKKIAARRPTGAGSNTTTASRVADRYLRVPRRARQTNTEQALNAALAEFDRQVEIIRMFLAKDRAHAGAIDATHRAIIGILNLIKQSGATGADKGLRKAVRVSADYEDTNFNRNWGSNEGLMELANYYAKNHEIGYYQGIVDQALAAMPDTEATVEVAGVTLHNPGEFPPDTVEDAAKVIRKAASLLGSYSKLLYGDAYIVTPRQYGQFQVDPNTTGALYHTPTDSIWFNPLQVDDRDTTERLLHEMGHRLYRKFLSGSQNADWEADWRERKDAGGGIPFEFPTRYAMTKPEEDFCEHFALWRMGKLPREGRDRIRGFLE